MNNLNLDTNKTENNSVSRETLDIEKKYKDKIRRLNKTISDLKKENEELKNELQELRKFKDCQGKGRKRKELKYSDLELLKLHEEYKMTYSQLASMCKVSVSTIKGRIREIKSVENNVDK